jgi:hypothetical protein
MALVASFNLKVHFLCVASSKQDAVVFRFLATMEFLKGGLRHGVYVSFLLQRGCFHMANGDMVYMEFISFLLLRPVFF